ncbi:MAG: Maf family protein, partial [Phycisphaerae bacterium]|nr:Maf family protein [Phycisphaerae bacterium]
MPQKQLILASASPRREELLARLRVPFVVTPCELAEPAERPSGIAPTSWSEALAYFKASGVPREGED